MNAAVILAAGSSQRMGSRGKKELLELEGRSVLSHSVDSFIQTDRFDIILITCPGKGSSPIRSSLPENPKLLFTTGGRTRQESVRLSLEYLAERLHKEDRILIHDGARPWIEPQLILSILDRLDHKEAVIPIEPSTSAMKQVDRDGRICCHLKREDTWAAQTPQGFHYGSILEAHRQALSSSELFIDDSEIWDRYIGPVWTVPGNPENKKITYRGDI